jgi:hypothetical protein
VAGFPSRRREEPATVEILKDCAHNNAADAQKIIVLMANV